MTHESITNQIKKLRKKAEQNRQMHFSICKKANIWNKLIHALALVGSSITAILTFAEFKTFTPWLPSLTDGNYKLIIGLFAGSIFILTILEEYLRLGEKAATHETIGKQLTTLIRRTSALTIKEQLTEEDLNNILAEYNSINDSAPIIPDRVFLKEKQRLKTKIDISKQLDSNPYTLIWLYRLKMKVQYIKKLFFKQLPPTEGQEQELNQTPNKGDTDEE